MGMLQSLLLGCIEIWLPPWKMMRLIFDSLICELEHKLLQLGIKNKNLLL
jgi:hypothetical protein